MLRCKNKVGSWWCVTHAQDLCLVSSLISCSNGESGITVISCLVFCNIVTGVTTLSQLVFTLQLEVTRELEKSDALPKSHFTSLHYPSRMLPNLQPKLINGNYLLSFHGLVSRLA